jgi:cellulose synthase/poly-beta-1,6-N-acetylglucosamine synthase-like glycosyltransferase
MPEDKAFFEMVKKPLSALAKLDYPDLEILVIDNNTKDPSVWQPMATECQRLGAAFRFFHLDNWPGYKAGAINYALQQTAKDAEIIALNAAPSRWHSVATGCHTDGSLVLLSITSISRSR